MCRDKDVAKMTRGLIVSGGTGGHIFPAVSIANAVKALRPNAKILFIGVKASSSNTMAIHMLADYMGSDWPIDDWYVENKYKVKLEDGIY